jgi:hypothetical protein
MRENNQDQKALPALFNGAKVQLITDRAGVPKRVKLNGVEVPAVAGAKINADPGEPISIVIKVWVSELDWVRSEDE